MPMIRFIILFIIGYFAYRGIRSWMYPNPLKKKTVFGKTSSEIDDVMIKDPFCEVYFPKRNGVHLKVDGKDLYFCSTKCKDKFIASREK